MSTDLPDWITAAALMSFWSRVRDRLEATGLTPRGRISVSAGLREERYALGELLGQVLTRERIAVDLPALDARLRQRSGVGGLVEVVAAVSGAPLRDRTAERTALTARRDETLEMARSLVQGAWVDEWVAGLRRTGLLTNRPDASDVVTNAATVLRALVDSVPAPQSRVDLSARLLGNSHALDAASLVSQVVLRGLAAASGLKPPASAHERRALWARYGISPDLVSSTCLALGLRTEGRDPVSVRIGAAAESGDPTHITAWDLRRWPREVRLQRAAVLVCENPRVLEAVAEWHGGAIPAVCTSGEPNTVVVGVLDRLRKAGCSLHYHGDFDWPGVAIANRLMTNLGVEPWLMTAADYEDSVPERGLALFGTPVEPIWDPELGAAMRQYGVAVHEEAVLERIVGLVPSM